MASVAIGYHGLIRGFRFPEVRKTHEDLLINELKSQGYEVDVYVHTFDKDYDESIKLVNPKKLVIDNDLETENYVKQYMKPYIFPHYFSKDQRTNYFKDMLTRKKVFEMITAENKSYTWVLMINPGNLIIGAIDDLRPLDATKLYIPDFSHHGGYNGRCAIGSMDTMRIYSSVFDRIVKYQNPPFYLSNPKQDIFDAKGRVTLHPESSIKIHLNMSGIYPLEQGYLLRSFVFERLRTDGTRVGN